MKGNSPAVIRALYIILVPVVLLIILLNSGLLQQHLTAVTVCGDNYSVVRYNFYYFDYYNTFLSENEDRLAELGYDPQQSSGEQFRADGLTWKEYFQTQAERQMALTAYYCDLAEEAGYKFSAEELAPVAAQLEANGAQCARSGISKANFYVAYYSAGMDEARYTEELTRRVQAQAYREHLLQTLTPNGDELAAWLSQYPAEDYACVNLRVLTLSAITNRETGQIGEPQLDALTQKLARLTERYKRGASFEELQAAFSACMLGGRDGVLANAVAGDLPGILADWCISEQGTLTDGDTFTGVDRDAGIAYFAVLDGFGTSGREIEAVRVLNASSISDEESAALSQYQVRRNSLGMLLAAA